MFEKEKQLIFQTSQITNSTTSQQYIVDDLAEEAVAVHHFKSELCVQGRDAKLSSYHDSNG